MKEKLEAILLQSVEGKAWHDPSVREAIEGADAATVAQHNAYHAGQIITLRLIV